MKNSTKTKIIKFILILVCLLVGSSAFAETLTLITYYQAPIGIYSQLRLTPHDTVSDPITCDATNEGLIYYDDFLNLLIFCGDTGASVGAQVLTTWVQENDYIVSADPSDDIYVGIGDFEPDALLEISASGQTLDYLYLSVDDDADGNVLSVRSSGNVGIGSFSPSFRLTLDESLLGAADGGILAVGNFGSGTALTHSGLGTKFIWYPGKNAFRAGYVDDDQWDNAQIGNDSVAFGLNSSALGGHSTSLSGGVASGNYSLAIGDEARAPGESSTSIGLRVTSTEAGSTTLGVDSTASEVSSVSIGNNNASLAESSVTLGFSNVANSEGSVAIGNSGSVSGVYSTIFGESNENEGAMVATIMGKDCVVNTSAIYSTVIGHNNVAQGQFSTVLGNFASAEGNEAFAVGGPGTNAQAYGSAALGRYHIIYGPGSVNTAGYTSTDPLFIVGNGTDDLNRSNALTIRRNANVAIGSDDPAGYRLRVYGGDANIDAANTWTTASDERLKKDIQPLVDALEMVSQLQGVTYHVLSEDEQDKKHIGVIAQEIEKVYPELVITANNGYKSVDYGRINAILIEAAKELKSQNELLNNELDEISNQLDQEIETLSKE